MFDGMPRQPRKLRGSSVASLRGDDEPNPYPVNAEIESALLGSIMISGAALGVVRDIIKPGHFGYQINGRIFEAMLHLADRGVGISPATLKGFLEQDAGPADFDIADYLVKVALSAVNVLNAAGYAATIVELAQRRELMIAAEELHDRASRQNLDDPVSGQIEFFSEALSRVEQEGAFWENRSKPYRSLDEVTDEALERAQRAYQAKGSLAGISTGIEALDKRIGGWMPHLTIIGGRPSSGKSALAITAIYHAARSGHGVYFWSGEMPGRVVSNRLLAVETGISVAKQTRGDLDGREWEDLVHAQAMMASWPVVIDDQSSVTPAMLRQRVKAVHRKMPLGLVVIDYLQLMGGEHSDESKETVPAASRAMARLAKELDVPVVALSQVKREVDLRDDKRPHQADLLWSGALEADARTIIMVYRESYYLARSRPQRKPFEDDEKFSKREGQWNTALEAAHGRAELILEKDSEGGNLGTVHCRFDGARSLFEDLMTWEGRGERLWS
jgi:replicative DNA helicase